MEPHIQKYDGWTRLGPGKKVSTGQAAGSNNHISNPSPGRGTIDPSVEASKRHIQEMIDKLAKMAGESGNGGIAGEVNMTQTGFLTSKTGKRFIRVDFSRPGKNGLDIAEGVIPGGKILKQSGFTGQEIESLEAYLKENKDEIVRRAKKLSNPLHWFK